VRFSFREKRSPKGSNGEAEHAGFRCVRRASVRSCFRGGLKRPFGVFES